MFNIGITEMLIIGVIALLILGPKGLPDFAKTIGKVLREFKKTSNDFKRTISQEIEDAGGDEIRDIKEVTDDLKKHNLKPKKVEDFLESASNLLDNVDVENKIDKNSKS